MIVFNKIDVSWYPVLDNTPIFKENGLVHISVNGFTFSINP